MPSSGKKGGKGDKEKRKREAEERRRIAEEEERIRQEQEERERRKREKTEAEERKKREKAEQKVRIVELAQLRALLGGYHASRDAHFAALRRDERWRRYLRCDGSPDPVVLPEINTYMVAWREDDKRVLIEDVLEDSKPCLGLIAELEDHLADDEASPEQVRQYRGTIADLQALLQQKLSRATYEMLRRGANAADSETMNLQAVWRSDTICLCLWGNLSKNPRIKTFEFPESGIGFDIPKALTKVGCAYQFLLTTFDHYSPQSASFYAVPIKKEEEVEPVVEEAEAADEAEGEGEGAEKGEEQVEEEPVREPTMDLMAELQRMDGEEPEEKEPEPEPEEELETPEEDLCVSPPPMEFEDFDGEEDAMDLRGYHTIGPVMQFNILQLPPQPQNKRGWTIVQHLVPPQPVSFDYHPQPIVRKELEELQQPDEAGDVNSVTEGSNPTTVSNQLTATSTQQQAANKKQPEIENPPISVSFKLPSNVFYAEEPKVACWDAERKEWRTDGIEVTKFDEDKRVLNFRTSVFGTLGFLQDFHINMPFQQWELRPLGTRSCRLSIIASINEVAINVKEDLVCIPETPSDAAEDSPEADPEVQLGKRELSHLEGKWMPVRSLIACLRAAGVNLFPREDSSKHVDVPDKSSIAEQRLYEQMALLSPAMAFAWSRWNSEIKDRDSLIVQACEHMEDCSVNEDDYYLFTVTRRHVRRLKIKEFAEEFSDEPDEAVGYHADFYNSFQEFSSQEAKDRVAEVDFQYLKTVTDLLSATRMLVFS
ncbi:hypothetical protein BOX15_Mlig033530g1 [Macrostomum lignano]|uniref:Uncharacterized protein n=3 Tax=Macrostomum lignano TaxID=282301 RepID=A0A267ECI0_9PLAT|nr:hypothetical protein BOX15_Mlig033530g3 [Macrostomum lignano]PAA58578.1 hypothetical protein BOX15_Mlig033530g2 [Macrostomum lignano]PAA58594.1 hypothetical protein BOX15_Mlig033530g1 [Macrostomum lignano]